MTTCIRGVQSCFAASNYKQSAFFTKHTMECARDAIAGSLELMGNSSFDPWVSICSAEQIAFERRYRELFASHLARKKESSYQQLSESNYNGHDTRSVGDVESSSVVCAGSASSSSVGGTTANVADEVGPSSKRNFGSLASLLGRKKQEKDEEPTCSKQKKPKRGTGGSKRSGASSKQK